MKDRLKWLMSWALILIFTPISWAQFQRNENGLVVRKNIDSLSAIELATFEHAIQILKDRSNANPFDTTGYAWQAWVHNVDVVYVPKSGKSNLKREDFQSDREFYEAVSLEFDEGPDSEEANPGNCLHFDERFLFWHRAEFYYFERILQDTNPNGELMDSQGKSYPTKDLAIPFWDFTLKPSGQRYAKALENPSSVLYHEFRARDSHPAETYNREAFLKLLWEENSWEEFGGGSSAWEQGAIESKFHNSMHNDHVGGGGEPIIRNKAPSMYSPNTAAYDPLFFVFHSFLEFALTKWIEVHSVGGITFDRNLRGTQPTQYHLVQGQRASSMGKSSLYMDNKKLGYTYEYTITDSLDVARELEAIERKSARNKSSEWLLTKETSSGPVEEVKFLNASFVSAEALLTDSEGKLNVDFPDHTARNRVDIYIHPVDVEAKIEKKGFRKKYFVEWATTWEHHTDHDVGGQKLTIDLRDEIAEIAEKLNGQDLVITTNLSVNN